MALLDLQGLSIPRIGAGFESAASMSCTPESNVSMAHCDDIPDESGLSIVLCFASR